MIPDQLETAHLSLRTFKADDACAVLDYWQSDPSWARYNASVPEQFHLADAQDFVATMCNRDRCSAPTWALVYQGTVVGIVSLTFEQGGRTAVVGYGVHGNLRGQGLSVEAAFAVIDKAFEHHVELEKIRAHTDGPSGRISLSKAGS
jgi:RimJ/RimL family protein N-acetyltransferase